MHLACISRKERLCLSFSYQHIHGISFYQTASCLGKFILASRSLKYFIELLSYLEGSSQASLGLQAESNCITVISLSGHCVDVMVWLGGLARVKAGVSCDVFMYWIFQAIMSSGMYFYYCLVCMNCTTARFLIMQSYAIWHGMWTDECSWWIEWIYDD